MTQIAISVGLGSTSLPALHGQALTDYNRYLADVASASGTLSAAEKLAAQTLLIETSTDRASLKRVGVFLGDANASKIPLIRDWGIAGADIAGGSGTTYSTLLGFTFNGSGYLRTGVIPSSQSGWSSLNFHAGTGLIGTDFTSASNKTLIGCNTSGGTGKLGIRHQASGPVVTGQLGLTSEVTLTASGTDYANGPCSGVWFVTARAANDGQLVRNGNSVATDTTFTTDSKPTVEMYVGGVNANGAFTEGTVGSLTHYTIGLGLTLAAMQRLTQAWNHFMQSTGRCRTICFSGDSMNVLTGTTDYPDRLKTVDFKGISTIGNAVGGTSSAVMVTSQATDYANANNSRWYNQIICTFRNDIGASGLDISPFRANMATFISRLGHGSYGIVQVIPQGFGTPGEYAGGANRIPIDTLKAAMVTDYGTKAWDDLSTLQAANNGGANDLADVAHDICPRSLMNADGKHLTTGAPITGNSVREGFVAAKIPNAVFP